MSLLMDSVAHAIDSLATSPMSESNQIQLALLTTRLCHLAKPDTLATNRLHPQRRASRLLDTKLLRESVKAVCEKSDVLSGLQEDLQV